MAGRGYEELPDKENADYNANRTSQYWAAATFYKQRARIINLEFDEKAMRARFDTFAKDFSSIFINTADRDSVAIDGKGRDALVDALVGTRPEPQGLSVNIGSERKQDDAPKPKRGL
jgi:hypothetical protein